MKLLCTADLHGTVPTQMKEIVNRVNPDAIVYGGDFAPHGWRGEGQNMEEVVRFLISLEKPLFFIHGNIDPSPNYFMQLERNYRRLKYIHMKRAKIGNYYLVGLGDYHFRPSPEYKRFEKLVNKDPDKTIIVSHYPPKGLVDLTEDGEHAGDQNLRELIEKYQPPLFLCGHIHEAAGVTTLGKTTIVNMAMKNILAEFDKDGKFNISLA